VTVAAEHAQGQPAFLAWAGAGFGAELVRLTSPDSADPSPGKKPTEPEWQTLAVTPDLVSRWARMPGNVGLRTKYFPAVDVDVDDAGVARSVEQLVIGILGSTARRTRANSARRALLFRLEGAPFKKKAVKFKLPNGTFAKVEILADGQQIAVAGVHPSGAPNEWPNGQPAPDALATMTEAQRDEVLDHLRLRLKGLGCVVEAIANGASASPRAAHHQEGWEHDEPFIDAALRVLDPDVEYDRWVAAGMALHAKYPEADGHGFNAWDSWSSRGKKYPGRDKLEMKWRTFKPGGGVNLASLFALAGVSVRDLAAERRGEQRVSAPEPTPPPDMRDEAAPEPPEPGSDLDVKPEAEPSREIPLVRACNAIENPVDWLIENFLARGELTDLSGDPGVGKGGITASWAARVTREDRNATVIFFATEDPLGRVKARLRAEGADLDRVWFLDITQPNASPILPGDVAQVEAAVVKHRAALLILDPALEFMAAELDSHKQQDVARFMAPLLGVAMRTNAALLTVRHNNKNAGASALHRASGSIGFTGKVRVALTATKNHETGARALAMTKNNLGKDRFTLAYDVVSKGDASVIAWGDVISTSADELVNQQPGKKKRGPPAAKLEAACDVLRELLSDGPMNVPEVVKAANERKVGRTVLYEAKAALEVEDVALNLRKAWRLTAKETPDGHTVKSTETPDNSGRGE
jgi:hypothetical protein